ncbi:MAG: fatty acid desaturase family protein [Actinomycetota bacterium]|nr:fatty acid desaturase family protein [Actinomycetota bacterium]
MSGMVPSTLPELHETPQIRADGRPTPAFREQLRRIPSWRNLGSVIGLYVQTGLLVWATVALAPWVWPITFLLMGRAFAQFASLMHEAAHRLLFRNKRANDLVGRWLLGFPSFTSTDAYRRVHMAHHRDEFGPDEPDIPLYIGYPIAADSFRRKLVRDATGQTGVKLMRQLLRQARSTDQRSRRTFWKIALVQAVLLGAAIASGHWWLYLLFWLAPYLTVWRVINRLRSVAEHGGMQRSPDRRESTHSVRQHLPARFLLVPYRIGWHLAHHVDSGVPFRNLPALHDALREAGYVDDSFEYPSYPAIWRALRVPAAIA